MGLPWKGTVFILFEIVHKYCILDFFVGYEVYSNFSKRFLPTAIDIMVIWNKLAHFHPFLVHWFLRYRCLLLPSAAWPLPVYLDSWTWHFRIICNSVLYSSLFLPSYTSTAGCHFHFGPDSILSGAISPLCFSSILDIYGLGGLIFQYDNLLPFHTIDGVLKARILKWFAIPFSLLTKWQILCQHSPPWPVCLRCPYMPFPRALFKLGISKREF